MCVLSWGTGVVEGEEDTKMQSERSPYPRNKQLQTIICIMSQNIQFPCYHVTVG